ncbi:MAG: hypothetical protein IJE41_03140 [Clostridia bacterium]|nr:hypothetical protein [Clostridia bacterium]MBQ6938000.1 hypothetical protein [Clostridia bacterium]MBR2886026.1 hypothetical protein [Clostridia bacterium]
MKKLGALFAVVIVILSCVSASAANPAYISANDPGTVHDLVVVKKPETKNSATLKKTYGITGTGKSGVKVAYYKFNGTSYISIKDSNGAMAQTTIGTANVFYKQVALSEGHNKFAVRAEAPNGTYQVEYFDINVLNQKILNNVSGFSNGIQSLYNGWMN